MYNRVRQTIVDGEKITTTVTKNASDIDGGIERFVSNADIAIGLDTEWTLVSDFNSSTAGGTNQQTKIAILALCDSNQCLIVQLPLLDYIPRSLMNFLRLPNFTFVGIGIIENVLRLEKDYGIGCKNAVELGPLAVKVMKKPRLIGCGIDELAREIDKHSLERPTSTVFDDWGNEFLNKKEIKCATVNTYAYHKIGNKLLGD